MRRVLILVLGLIFLVGTGPAVAAPTAAAKSAPVECIYMVRDVHKYSWGYEFELMFWRKKGKKIRGVHGGYPGSGMDQRLTIKGKRAIGSETFASYPPDPVSYRLVGKGKTLRVKGWKRVSRAYLKAVTHGEVTGMGVGKC